MEENNLETDQKGNHQPERLHEVLPIQESRNQIILKRKQIPNLVETPLVSTCVELYDKNIRTLESSANAKDIERGAVHFSIEFDSLSEENKQIASQLGTVAEADKKRYIAVTIPVDKDSLVKDIQDKTNEIADKFKKQKMTWAPTFTKSQLVEYSYDPTWSQLDPEEISKRTGYFYDKKNNIFYISEEHYHKVNENFEDSR